MEAKTLFILKKIGLYVDVTSWNKIIGLTPLFLFHKGDSMPKKDPTTATTICPDSLWIFGVARQQTASIEEQLTNVLEKTYQKKEAIKRLITSQNLSLVCEVHVWFGEEDAHIDFGHDIFKKLADLGASLQLEYYD